MKSRFFSASLISALCLISHISQAAYIPSQPWSTLTPDVDPIGTTDYTVTFGIQVIAATSGSSAYTGITSSASISAGSATLEETSIATGGAKRTSTATVTASVSGSNSDSDSDSGSELHDVSASSSDDANAFRVKRAVVTQIDDGQIQETTQTLAVVSQINDGQIQATTKTAAVVTQINDGQVQATTETTVGVVTQIGDGQVQATTKTTAVVTQIADGQVQAKTSTVTATANGEVTQIDGGQVQAVTSTANAASQVNDGQVQQATSTSTATSSASASDDTFGAKEATVACASSDALSMTLSGGILKDNKGRIGSIVANRQFQFDGPPPQAGAIYAAGWSISSDGNLAIGDTTVFYQCLSGTFYNLYDQTLGPHCSPVYLNVVNLVSC
ncbi:unnamed protein product [Ambrosiozyma monospora]|uniref:Unnamed protein product n=1 Tax=Ambrosiozyma monospora TaxID=43982 RepID=A0A9W7DEV5_AMBMO|nr:unnamed protein product [Ambrosiozyma monospora]